MWNADLHGYDAGAIANSEHAFVGRVLQQIKNAADGGARVINLSLGVPHHWPDSTRVVAGRVLDSTLSALGARGRRPLVVIAAGNSTMDASVAGFTRVSTGTNADQVVVVVASTKDSALWAGAAGGSGSNFGPLVTVAAPGKTVYFLRQNGSIDSSSGTSASAPIVSGIAGLLLSFDSRLQANDLKRFIVDGAAAGNWKATRLAGGEQYPIVNAYESLKLAAQREGAPLCGNRVWSSDGVIVTRRSSGVKPLFTFGEPGSYVNVRHGGKRVDVFGWESIGGIFLFNGSGWEQDLSDTLPDTLAGGTYNSSTSVSHDSDSLTYAWGSSTPNSTRYDVHVVSVADWRADRPNKVAEFTVSSGGSGDVGCWRQKWVDSLQNYECTDSVAVGPRIQGSARETFSPLNDRIIVAINRTESNTTLGNDWLPCPGTDTLPGTQRPRRQCKTQRATHRSVGVEFREILRPSNQVRTLLWELGGTDNVYSLGISEDGKELVLGIGGFQSARHQEPNATFTWVDEGTTDSNCRVSYRVAATFNLLHDEPTDDVCSRDAGVGTIAPIRRGP